MVLPLDRTVPTYAFRRRNAIIGIDDAVVVAGLNAIRQRKFNCKMKRIGNVDGLCNMLRETNIANGTRPRCSSDPQQTRVERGSSFGASFESRPSIVDEGVGSSVAHNDSQTDMSHFHSNGWEASTIDQGSYFPCARTETTSRSLAA